MRFLSRVLFALFACSSVLCVNAQEKDDKTEQGSIVFVSKCAKAERIIKGRRESEIAERINEIVPTPENPFPSGITPVPPAKFKMIVPQVSENKKRVIDKEAEAAKKKALLEEKKRLAEQRRAERHARSWMLFDEREKEDAKRRAEKEKREKEAEEKDQQREDFQKFRELSVDEVFPHAAAAFFPGAVPEAVQRVNKAFKTDNEIRDWQFTGVYAPPGEIIRVHVSSAGIGTGYRIRIGVHEDNLLEGQLKDAWRRFPTIVREFGVDNSTIEIANPFGGMIYVLAPPPPARSKISSASQRRVPRYARFQFIGVVEAPQFELSDTKPAEWMHLRNAPAPWAQIAGKNFIATVPSSAVRKIEKPQEIVEFWDKRIEELNKLSGREEREKNAPRECIVFDVDSTEFAGHAGETIVFPVELVNTFLDLDYIRKNGSFGLFFYLAKNRVRPEWTLNGNTDAPAALLALHCMERATERKAHTFFDAKRLLSSALTKPEEAGTPEVIGSYLPLLEAFGWDPLFKALDVYNNKKRPLTETERDKAETFVTVWSRGAKTNFGPYFENFGIEYSKRLQMRLEKLRKFSPKQFPPPLGLEKASEDCFRGDTPLGSVEIFFSDYFPQKDEEEFLNFEDAEIISDDAETEGESDEETMPEGGEAEDDGDSGSENNSENEKTETFGKKIRV